MRLDEFLHEKGLSGVEFSRLVRCSPAAVTRWVKGQRIPTRQNMLAILRATRGAVTPADFYSLTSG